MGDFRPPSAGDLPDTASDKAKESAGRYYKLTIDYIKEILNDPKSAYPDYDPNQGYELAGFVWFQGFNDLVGPYPRADGSNNKKSAKDYSEYSRLLACFIRDVRKDLAAPGLPFVVGVLGVAGETDKPGTLAFRNAMAAPADLPEFKGNVVNVFTHKYWPNEVEAVQAKAKPLTDEQKKRSKAIVAKKLSREEQNKQLNALREEIRGKLETLLTQDELFTLDYGSSNAGFHYYGSAKCFAQIGKAFADALTEMD